MNVDVVVVGAGTAGAAAAVFCARRGLSVLCLDRLPLEGSGAQWVNGVPASTFDRVGIERPRDEELRGQGHDFHLVAGWEGPRVVVSGHDVLEVDMRLLGRRLRGLAAAEGAELIGECRVLGLAEQSDTGAVLQTSNGPIHARWIVDASGLAGARLLGQDAVDPRHICAAAQEVRAVRDTEAARVFFERRDVRPGSALCFSGVAGGFSVLTLRLDGDEVSILTGSIPADGHPSGLAVLHRFVEEQSWIGERLFGGARAIPLQRPRDCLAKGSVALLGDAACQVFPAHGSGIGAGLLAASTLADALADGRGAAGYAVQWQREYGALYAAYDVFRRFSQTLSIDEMVTLVDAGLLDAAGVRAGLDQQWPELGLASVFAKARGAIRAPALTARFLPVLLRMGTVAALYRRYPATEDRRPLWSRRVARRLPVVAQSSAAGRAEASPRPEVS